MEHEALSKTDLIPGVLASTMNPDKALDPLALGSVTAKTKYHYRNNMRKNYISMRKQNLATRAKDIRSRVLHSLSSTWLH